MSKIYWNKRKTLNPIIAKMTLFLSNQKIMIAIYLIYASDEANTILNGIK